eukprot:110148_1
MINSIFIFLLFVLGRRVNGEKVRGTVNVADTKGFSFLGKFCFQDIPSDNFTTSGPAAGTVDVELTNKGSFRSVYQLVMYDDQENSWIKIYQTGLTCDKKINGHYDRLKEQITLGSDSSHDTTIKIHQHIRPRWWWLYLANCDAYDGGAESRKNLTAIDFELHFKQNLTSWLKIEVGSNDQGLNIMYSVYLGVYIILFGLQ